MGKTVVECCAEDETIPASIRQHGMKTAIVAEILLRHLPGPYASGSYEDTLLAVKLGCQLHDYGHADNAEWSCSRDISAVSEFSLAEAIQHPQKSYQYAVEHMAEYHLTLAQQQLVFQIALLHHEKVDGTGYSQKLSGAAIPMLVQLCAMADLFATLVSEKPPSRRSLNAAKKYVEKCAGRNFSTAACELFSTAYKEVADAIYLPKQVAEKA